MPQLSTEGTLEPLRQRVLSIDLLLECEELAKQEGFTLLTWSIKDEQGTHTTDAIAPIIQTVLWPSAGMVDFTARTDFGSDMSEVFIWDFWPDDRIVIKWKAPAEKKVAAERLAKKLWNVLDARELVSAGAKRFSASKPHQETSKEPAISTQLSQLKEDGLSSSTNSELAHILTAAEGKSAPWWSLLRAPRSLIDWTLIGVIAAIIGGIILQLL